jgi:ribose 5-phosphate isomerase B
VAPQVIGIASDHAAFDLKLAVLIWLKDQGFEVRDFGTHSTASFDYPETIVPCAQALSRGECTRAIVMCGSGIGASICANKVKSVRAALCLEAEQAKLSRQHNDANCLVLSGRLRSIEINLDFVRIWFQEEFEGGRHQRRIDLLHEQTGC